MIGCGGNWKGCTVHVERQPDDLDPVLREAVSWLREPVPFPEAGGVAAALARLPERRPSDLTARSLLWLALAAGLGILAVGLNLDRSRPGAADAVKRVRFAVDLPAGVRVALIGDFNDWNPQATPLTREPGGWSATVPLAPGRYRYTFVVDGQRLLADPSEPAADDEFGAPTSVITVAD